MFILHENEDGAPIAEFCECRQKAIMQNRLKFANIPEAFKDLRLKTFRSDIYQKPESKQRILIASKIIKRFLSEFEEMKSNGMGLYIHSETKGSGKTRMATSIANELIYEKSTQVRFATSATILQEIKNTWDRDNEYSESRLLSDLTCTEVLIIDDFGTEKANGWVNEKFYQIINERYVNRKITIFTSNLPLEQLSYDDRITNRIKERTYQIAFPEESIRDVIAKRNNEEMINRILEG